MESKRTVFLTGATGLVGSYLLKILLENGHKVYALARSKNDTSAQKRVEDILNFWDENVLKTNSENLIVIEGDMTKEDLGLGRAGKELESEINEVFHSAAVTDLNWALEDIRKVNVEGTKNVLEFSLRCNKGGKLKKVNHISTAYVCGDYKGDFKEGDLDVGQKFNTTYEQSKFEAERIVGEYRKKSLWIDILRPSVVVGEFMSGRIDRFRNIYQFLYLCSLEIFDAFPLEEADINIISIDYLARAIHTIFENAKEKNIVYHIFPQDSVSIKELVDVFSEHIGTIRPKTVSLAEFIDYEFTFAQRMLLDKSISILNIQVKLKSFFTNKFLANCGFEFPEWSKERFLALFNHFAKNKLIARKSKYE